jgi:hypothetical protein
MVLCNTYENLHDYVKRVLLRFLIQAAVNDWRTSDIEPKFSADIYTSLKIRV